MSYEQIILTFRTLADKTRLRILLLLSGGEELSASQISDKLRLSRPNTSFHLRMLCASGLVWRRRSGAWIFHSLPSGDQKGWPRSLVRALQEAVKDYGVKQLRNHRDLASPPVATLVNSLFRIVTAFTSLRRLLLINCLRQTTANGPHDLLAAVPMSLPALSRHMAKLTSRGYLRSHPSEKGSSLRIPGSFESRLQARVLSALFEALDLAPARKSDATDR